MNRQEILIDREEEFFRQIKNEPRLYWPLEMKVTKEPSIDKNKPDYKIDLNWGKRKATFLAEVKSRTAPKGIFQALAEMKSWSRRQNQQLLLVVPFLSDSIIEILTSEGASGVDFNGNYFIQAPEFLAIRRDQKNRFTESQSIKNIFSGNSSLVGRLFLTQKRPFRSVNEVRSSISALGGNLSLSATSKVLKRLEEELIIQKTKNDISLLQPEKLIQRLETEYRPPKITASMNFKLPRQGRESVDILRKLLGRSTQWVLSGETSAERYAVTTRAEVFRFYATDLEPLFQFREERFFNAVVQRTSASFPYFDAREENSVRWSSPVQSYLELSRLDKREKELASSIRESILKDYK